jgi:hypothetical protein
MMVVWCSVAPCPVRASLGTCEFFVGLAVPGGPMDLLVSICGTLSSYICLLTFPSLFERICYAFVSSVGVVLGVVWALSACRHLEPQTFDI